MSEETQNQHIHLDGNDYITNDRELVNFCRNTAKDLFKDWEQYGKSKDVSYSMHCYEHLMPRLKDSEHVIYTYRSMIICTFCDVEAGKEILINTGSIFRSALEVSANDRSIETLARLAVLATLFEKSWAAVHNLMNDKKL